MRPITEQIENGTVKTIDIDVKESDVFYFIGRSFEYGIGAKRLTLSVHTPVHTSTQDALGYLGYPLPNALKIFKVQGFQKGDLLQPIGMKNHIYVTYKGAYQPLIISDVEPAPSFEPPAAAWPKAPAAAPQFKAQTQEKKENAPLLETEHRSDSHNKQKTSRLCC